MANYTRMVATPAPSQREHGSVVYIMAAGVRDGSRLEVNNTERDFPGVISTGGCPVW